MKPGANIAFDKQVYYRLIALWIFCEAILGGIIHGLKLPVSGLIAGSCSVICICLIAKYVPLRNVILKATIIVAIFKMMLSPHSPPTAYIAVFFQGLMGQVLFNSGKVYKASCILLGVLALAESALQRILLMIIVFGNDIWKAINETISKLVGQNSESNYSLLLGIGYVALHVLVGFFIGVFAYRLTKQKIGLPEDYQISDSTQNAVGLTSKKRSLKTGLLIIWILLLLLFIQSQFSIGKQILPVNLPLQIIFRSLLIVLTWYFVVSPLLLSFVRKWLQHHKQKQASDIQAVALILPCTQNMIYKSWQLSADEKGFQRLKKCCKIILMNSLRPHA